ncbi:hypothetical protein C7E15_02040 [Stenotrophomonas maltophilia]|nr:hypothetical protein C7E15_02040 [Stenotrophomonas maltophilia]
MGLAAQPKRPPAGVVPFVVAFLPPTCLGMLATLNGTPVSPWREAPAAASSPQRASPPMPDPLRPPIA